MPAKNPKEYQQKWRAANRERSRKYVNDWWDRNKKSRNIKRKKQRAGNKEHYKNIEMVRRYGITLEQWDMIFESQNECCAICKTAEPGPNGWHTDHCHNSGKVRGILCGKCNGGLGFFRDNSEYLKEAANYVK